MTPTVPLWAHSLPAPILPPKISQAWGFEILLMSLICLSSSCASCGGLSTTVSVKVMCSGFMLWILLRCKHVQTVHQSCLLLSLDGDLRASSGSGPGRTWKCGTMWKLETQINNWKKISNKMNIWHENAWNTRKLQNASNIDHRWSSCLWLIVPVAKASYSVEELLLLSWSCSADLLFFPSLSFWASLASFAPFSVSGTMVENNIIEKHRYCDVLRTCFWPLRSAPILRDDLCTAWHRVVTSVLRSSLCCLVPFSKS